MHRGGLQNSGMGCKEGVVVRGVAGYISYKYFCDEIAHHQCRVDVFGILGPVMNRFCGTSTSGIVFAFFISRVIRGSFAVRYNFIRGLSLTFVLLGFVALLGKKRPKTPPLNTSKYDNI